MLTRWAAFVVLTGSLMGCAAVQQQQAMTEAKSCFATLKQSPEYAVLMRRSPDNSNAATLQQLSDPSFISPEESVALTTLHPRAKFCQTQFVDRLQNSAPTVASLFAENYRDQDEEMLALLQRRVSWGEFTRRRRDRSLAYQSRFAAEQQRLSAESEARSAGLIQALATAAAISQQSSQPSSLPAGASRYPSSGSSTTCTQRGHFTNCTHW